MSTSFFKRFFFLLIYFVLSISFIQSSLYAAEEAKPKSVTIAYNVGNPPLKFKNNKGEADGILIDIWKLWSEKTGVKVVFKEALFSETLEMLKRGEVDIHAGLFYTKERDKFFDYSSKPIIDISYHIFHHKSITGLFTVDTLKGFKVGVPKGYTQTFMSDKIQKDSLNVYENFPKLYDDVVAGNIKTFISPAMNFEYYLLTNNIQNDWRYNPSSLVYKRKYMSAVKEGNKELLKILNRGLALISDKEIIEIERKWLKSSIKINGTKDTYIISCDSDYAPLTMLNQQGEPAGFFIDLWRLWAKKQNVNVKFLFNNWGESIKAVKEGLSDFHSGLEGDENWQLLSKPFYELKANVYYPVNHDEKGIKDFYDKNIGSIDPFYLDVLKKSHTKIKTVDIIDYPDMFIKLKSGAIDAFLDDELAIKDLLLKQGRQGDYTNVSDYSYISKVSAATTKENKKLINFIESGLSKISSEEYLRLEKRWIGEGYFHNELKKDALKRSVPLTNEEADWLLEHPIIRIGVDAGYAPYAFVDKHGKFQGVAADFATIISDKLGIKMKMVPGLSWPQIIQASKDKTIDLITTASYRPEREEFLNFSRGYIPTPLVIMTRSDDGRVKKRADIAGLKIALVKEYSSSKSVMKEFKGLDVLDVKTPLEGLQAVSIGKADAYVGVLGINIYQANKGGITNLKIATHYDLKTNYQNYGVRKDWPIFASILDKALDSIPEDEVNRIFQKWTGVQKQSTPAIPIRLSDKEKQWLQEHPIIHVGADQNWPPFDFVDDEKVHKGIASDYIHLMEKTLGVKFVVRGDEWKKVLKSAKERELDMLACAGITEPRKEFFNFSKPYVEIDTVIVARKDDKRIKKIEDLFGKHVALPKNNFVHDQLKGSYPEIKYYFTKSNEEAVQAVALGKADAYVGNLAVAGHFIQQHMLTNLEIVSKTPFKKTKLCLTVRKDWPELVTIFNKVLDNVPQIQSNKILQKWLPPISYAAVIKKDIGLTAEEKKWIESNPMVKIAYMNYWPTDDDANNIHTDLLKLLSRYSDLSIVPTKFDRWKDGFDEAIDGKNVHGIMNLSWSKEREQEYFHYTKAYNFIPNYIVVKKENNDIKSLKDLEGKTVYLKEKEISHKMVSGLPFSINTIDLKDDHEMMTKLSVSDEAEAYLSYTADKQKLKKHDLKIAKLIYDKYGEVAIGVSRKHKHLQSIINKIYKIIPKEELLDLQNKTYKKSEPKVSLNLSDDEKEWLKKHPVLKVSSEVDWPPFDYVEYGISKGISIDYLKLIQSRIDSKFEFVQGTWTEVLTKFKDREIDILHPGMETDERKTYGDFLQPHIRLNNVLMVRDTDKKTKSLDDLNGKTVAVMKDWANHKIIQKNHPEINFFMAKSPLDALKAVSSGKADAYIDNMIVSEYLMKKHFIGNLKILHGVELPGFGDMILHVISRNDMPMLHSILLKAQSSITPADMEKIYDKWGISFTLETPKVILSQEEKSWLSEHKEIRLGIDMEWAPIEYLDENGELSGLSGSIIKRIEEILGVTFVIDKGLNWQDTMKNAKAKGIDVLSALRKTDERSKYLDFTEPYISLPNLIFTGKNTPYIASMDYLKNKKVCVIKGYAVEEIMKNNYPDVELILVNNTVDGLKKLSQGEADAFIANAIVTSHYISQLGFTQIKISGEFPYAYDLSLAVRNDWKILTNILQKTLDAITKEEIQKLYKQNIGIRYEKHVDYTLVWQILFVALLILGGTFYWNRRLSYEVELRQKAEDEANEANKAKSMFLANMSHEIRTPMNAVMGMLYLVQRTELNDIQNNYILKAHNAASSLLGIINDILDFSKIEANKLQLESTDFELDDVISNLSNIISFKAEDKGIEFLINHDPNIPKILVGDSLRLGQILINIANNAVKFTDEGEVVLSMKLLKKEDHRFTIQFCIKDSGIGMGKDEQEKLFHEFTQVDSSMTRKYGGTGLGLTISKRLVSMMNGKIWIESSELGKGSIFCFTVELKSSLHKTDELAKSDLLPEAFKNMHVLVVDDNLSARDVLSDMLKSFDFNVDTVSSGENAISAIKQCDKDDMYSLILMDWKMPDTNGIEVSKIIRADESIEKQPKIIMVTAYAKEEIMVEADEARIDGFLIKPVSPSLLFNSIMHAFGRDVIKKVAIPEEVSLDTIIGANILLVEDNEMNQEFAMALLSNVGLEVHIAGDGLEALEMIQQKPYDAVLMDIQMPKMDGLEATQRIRKLADEKNDEFYAKVPIIAMTALAMTGDREKFIEAGMDDYVSKPIDPDALFKTLLKWIKPRKGKHPKKIKSDVEKKEMSAEFPELDGLFVKEALKRLANDTNMYKKILLQFKGKYSDIVSDIQNKIVQESIESAEQKCHEFKGISGNIGAHALFNITTKLDNILKSGENPSAELFEKFEKELKVVIDSISSFEETQKEIQEETKKETHEEFDQQKVIELLNDMLENLDTDIGKVEDDLDKLEPLMRSSKEDVLFNELSNKTTTFDIDGAKVIIEQLINKMKGV